MIRKLALTASLGAMTLAAACAQDANIPTEDRAAMETVVRDYILANPEIIEDALIALSQKRADEEVRQNTLAVAENADNLFNASADYSIGPDDAPVTVVEFFDYRCPPCRASMETINALPERYKGQVRVVFKEFPILSPESRVASIATLAAGRQGKYIEMHRALMTIPAQQFSEETFTKVARQIELDIDQWNKDRKDSAIEAHIEETYELARNVGADATPAFVVGGQVFTGLDRVKLETLITQGIAKAG